MLSCGDGRLGPGVRRDDVITSTTLEGDVGNQCQARGDCELLGIPHSDQQKKPSLPYRPKNLGESDDGVDDKAPALSRGSVVRLTHLPNGLRKET